MRNIEKLRNYFLGKDPQLKETMADNSLRLIGIEGKHFVLRIEMLRKLEALKKELTDEDEELQQLIDNLETALDDLELKHERDIAAVEEDIGAEESARTLADNALSGRIDENAGNIAGLTFWKNTTDFVLASDLATALLDYYTKDEVDQLISVIPTFDIQVVQTLPAEGDSRVLYLAPSQDPETSNVYDEFIWVIPTGQLIGQWEKIGSTAVDMSNYYTKSETDTLLNAKQGTLTAGSNVQINGNTISATDTTYDNFVGATGSSAGTSGLVPAPAVADNEKYLKADGTWDTPQGGGGTSDYDDLTDKPQINGVTLAGNKTAADLGLEPKYEGEEDLTDTIEVEVGYEAPDQWCLTFEDGVATTVSNTVPDWASDTYGSYRIEAKAGEIYTITGTNPESGDYNYPVWVLAERAEIPDPYGAEVHEVISYSRGAPLTDVQITIPKDCLLLLNISPNLYDYEEQTLIPQDYSVVRTCDLTTTIDGMKTDISGKQDQLTAGTNITITDNVISATGGSSDYTALNNKPSINNVILTGNKTSADLGLDMVILSYGNSTWQEFLDAYNRNAVVYCRASSASDPASGSQTRLAFMAYVNNATNPTEVEFQYYRSVGTKTASQQGDQVFVYKLTSSGTWTVTTRENGSKVVPGTNMTSSYSNGVLTLNATGGSGEMNVIDSISVNGVAQTPDANKNVDLTVPTITYGTTDLTPGTSTLADGEFYFVYE